MDYTERYKRIVDELIRESFSNLKDSKIIILDFVIFKKFTAHVLDFSFLKLIFINPKKITKLSSGELVGLFAHELSHFERYKKRKFFEKISFIVGVIFSKKIRFEEERSTDILTIKKGYGKQLLKCTIKREKRYECKLDEIYSLGYLSPKQIKQEMKKLK